MLVTDDKNTFAGKKLLAEGSESYSYTDIDNMIKQTYSTQQQHKDPIKYYRQFFTQWQLFFHGNTHIINMDYMLNFLQNKNPQFTDYESITSALEIKPKSFREYYTHKAEIFKSEKDNILSPEEPDDLRLPKIDNYWNVSLD